MFFLFYAQIHFILIFFQETRLNTLSTFACQVNISWFKNVWIFVLQTRQKYQVRFFFFSAVWIHLHWADLQSYKQIWIRINSKYVFSLSFPLWCIWLIWFWGNESRFSTLARLARFIAFILHLREEMYHVRPVLMHQIIYFNAKTSLVLIKSIFYE